MRWKACWSSAIVKPGISFRLAVTLTAGLFVGMLASPGLYALYGKGAKPASTNAPGETACQDAKCHTQHPLNSGTGQLGLAGVPAAYEAGMTYPLTISLSQTGQKRWGFQITALASSNLAAGIFSLSDAERTQLRNEIMPDGNRRLYVEHTLAGSHMGRKDGPVMWQIKWQATGDLHGPVYFYLAANAANFNKKPWGDFIYTRIDTAGSPPGGP